MRQFGIRQGFVNGGDFPSEAQAHRLLPRGEELFQDGIPQLGPGGLRELVSEFEDCQKLFAGCTARMRPRFRARPLDRSGEPSHPVRYVLSLLFHDPACRLGSTARRQAYAKSARTLLVRRPARQANHSATANERRDDEAAHGPDGMCAAPYRKPRFGAYWKRPACREGDA